MESRSYYGLIQLKTFDERFDYLSLKGSVGKETFGFERWMNQRFYNSYEWKHIRDEVIARDNGFDLGHPDFPISGKILVHHMRPLSVEMLEHSDHTILDPNYLISCSLMTHNAIHYGTNPYSNLVVERKSGDTCPWR